MISKLKLRSFFLVWITIFSFLGLGLGSAQARQWPQNFVRSASAPKMSTQPVCLKDLSYVCAFLEWEKKPGSKTESQFKIHLTPVLNTIKLKKVELLMENCSTTHKPHSGAPVEVDILGSNVYQVRDAFFNMPGFWTVKLKIQVDKSERQLEILIPID